MGLLGTENFFCNQEILPLILIVLLFNGGTDCLFNEETLAVIIILWLICSSGFFGKKDCC